MILSMTGFGESTRTHGGVTYSLAIRSLNNRYFKLTCKLPDTLAFLEAGVEARLRKSLGRGSVFLTLQTRNMSAAAAYEVNETALASYVDHLRKLPKGDLPVTMDLATAILLPGVAQPRQQDEHAQAELTAVVNALVDDAIARLNHMRATEGEALAADLTGQLHVMSRQLAVVAQRAPVVVKEYQQRLADRVNELLAGQKMKLEADALAREVALYADRSDINEEVSRLTSHIAQFRSAIDEPAAADEDGGRQVGRKLDFIAQEFLREVNTISSKSNDATISRACVEMKSAIDRVKEQVQNAV